MVYDKLFSQKRTKMDTDFYNTVKELSRPAVKTL